MSLTKLKEQRNEDITFPVLIELKHSFLLFVMLNQLPHLFVMEEIVSEITDSVYLGNLSEAVGEVETQVVLVVVWWQVLEEDCRV
jgi:hypothetical protein